ncbi:PH domain-containing protein [Hirsutella rhossiliensis]|uniref:PH domain-containing protein n=1 Tax=Hirsutella rhossiliensis TaxID=111463 RepID=A0A9P8N020_9HYPO|nr:PH domain-containing protein [Hirsutella rhossiliensis]KAH0964374.1 PH domain-containing protein [Hirsutella rhossiliensis]
MASSLTADGRPSLPAPGDAANDPFVAAAAPKTHHRFSDFDQDLFAAGPGSSPTQAKLALEAHLAETDRRLDEAGKLGTALVSQRKALTEQLHEVEQLQAEGQIGPDLRKKLVEIEREYNDVARESARVFLPKQRVPSNEVNPGSPYVPEARSGRRSVSPSKFESQATGSPTKLNVPNRRSRNQPTNRVHDIEFAAEISTSLIAQVRNLQSLLSERDEENKTLHSERTKLEIEAENLQQRLRTLDESEHRYKEENWNLETRLQELSSQQREAADREKRLTQALGITNADKTAAQKDLDEVKLSLSKLAEEHAAVIKHHDIELGTAKRTMVMAEGERTALQRKIDDLTSQNQELAKAFSQQRGRATDREPGAEHSPPPSPIKGTPRHSMLETETVKTSLQHAQRTIQSQRNQLHREKTEKLELRRLIQDLRDDLEKAKNDATGAASNRRSRKVESKDLKKSQRLLGNFRSSRHEILVDDPEWEDNPDVSPGGASASTGPARGPGATSRGDASDQFETANEASESAFETANERATETEDFQTGNEELSGSDDTETETGSPSRGFGRMRRPPSLPAGLARQRSRGSFDSTASTSADEEDSALMRTPTASLSSQRSRLRLGRGGSMSRTSRQTSEEPSFRSSPASFASGGTPQAGQSLFAELQDLGGSDEESGAGTPSRRSTRSFTPGSMRRNVSPPPAVPQLPNVIMVDSGVMTEPVKITTDTFQELPPRPISMESIVNTPVMRPSTVWRDSHDADATASRPLSTVSHGETEVQTPPTPPTLRLTPLSVQHVEPLPEPEIPLPGLSLSTIMAEWLEPVAEPEVPRPELTLAPVLAQTVAPIAEPDVPKQMPAAITPALPELIMSIIRSEHVEPVSEPNILVTSPSLTLSTIRAEQLEPKEERESVWPQPPLAFSDILAEHVQPVSEPPPVGPTLALSPIATEHTHPITEPPPSPPALAMSSISSEHVEPVATSLLGTPTPPNFGFTNIESIETRPLSPRSLRRDGFILPRDDDFHSREPGQPEPPFNNKALGLALGRGKKGDFVPIIAEDETSQTPRDAPDVETPESQRPFKEISSNSNGRLPRKQREPTSDQGAQTSLTSSAIDKLLNSEPQQEDGQGPPLAGDPGQPSSRPGSATSGKGSTHDVPPLPSNHRQLIDAARSNSVRSTLGTMGPPLWPASAMKQQRPRTPLEQRPTSAASARATATPRFNGGGSAHGTAEIYSPSKLTARSRKSSVSSFASELDTRFNIRPGEMGMGPAGFSPDTDPRMIQAITQTMIGEFLWKYTRKPGRGEISENRHRRYFWVHPYTRTLYWSDRDPSTAGRTELKAKSVPIEAVRVVSDDNPMPPGLHRKSLIIISPGRTIKFTCTTGQRHETWFNALSYLLLRTDRDGQSDAEEMAETMTREDVEEFNPQFGRRPANGNQPERAPPSLSSYHSRTTRNETLADGASMEIPTLTPANYNRQSAATRTSAGTLSKLSGYWKAGAPKLSGTFSSLRGRGSGGQPAEVYEASAVHDSAEDLREMIERQDRDSDRLENVRACCDGKHDVGTLTHSSRAGRGPHTHSHASLNMPMASTRSRA